MKKKELYQNLTMQLAALLENEHDLVANLANTSALLYQHLDDINWAGFYLLKNDELILGPFQGKVACMHIAIGKGVCGTCIKEEKVQRINDVHAFPGHIACDAESRSEIVIPLYQKQTLIGVLDIDSPSFNRFDIDDEKGLQSIVNILEKTLI